MDDEKTIISQKSMLDDEGLNKSHASLIVLKGAEIGRDFRLRKTWSSGVARRNLSTTMGHSTGLIREQCPVW